MKGRRNGAVVGEPCVDAGFAPSSVLRSLIWAATLSVPRLVTRTTRSAVVPIFTSPNSTVSESTSMDEDVGPGVLVEVGEAAVDAVTVGVVDGIVDPGAVVDPAGVAGAVVAPVDVRGVTVLLGVVLGGATVLGGMAVPAGVVTPRTGAGVVTSTTGSGAVTDDCVVAGAGTGAKGAAECSVPVGSPFAGPSADCAGGGSAGPSVGN
jgi:hypothetical protein